MYLRGLPDAPLPCGTNGFAGPGDPPAYLEFAMLHEIVHTLGIVPSCAPNHHRSGHVSDDPDDLMWAGDDPWVPSGWAAVKLDAGNDDYFRHALPGCPDLADSLFLTGNEAPQPPPEDEDPRATRRVTSRRAARHPRPDRRRGPSSRTSAHRRSSRRCGGGR